MKLLVADVAGRHVEPVIEYSEQTRLGKGLYKTHRLQQEAIRFSLRELDVPVVRWDGVQSLDLPLAGYARRPLATGR